MSGNDDTGLTDLGGEVRSRNCDTLTKNILLFLLALVLLALGVAVGGYIW